MASRSRVVLAHLLGALTVGGCAGVPMPTAEVPARTAAVVEADVAIVGATLIDGTGAAPRAPVTVLLRGDRIVAIGATGELAVPAQAQVIDAAGKTVMPGLA